MIRSNKIQIKSTFLYTIVGLEEGRKNIQDSIKYSPKLPQRIKLTTQNFMTEVPSFEYRTLFLRYSLL